MKNFPTEYFLIEKDGTSYFKAHSTKKVKREIDPYTLASTPVIFENGCTVNTIFKLVENNPHIKPILYYVDEFIEESKKDVTCKDISDMKLRFSWDYIETDKEYIHINYPKMYVDAVDNEGNSFGIEFLASNNLKNLELTFDIALHVLDSEGKEVINVDTYPTLLQVIYGLFWELSFFGSPLDRDKKSQEILDEINKIEK